MTCAYEIGDQFRPAEPMTEEAEKVRAGQTEACEFEGMADDKTTPPTAANPIRMGNSINSSRNSYERSNGNWPNRLWNPNCRFFIAKRSGFSIQGTNCDPSANDSVDHVFVCFENNS